MSRIQILNVTAALPQTARAIRFDFSMPFDANFRIAVIGVPAGAVLRFAVSRNGETIYTKLGIGGQIDVSADDIKRKLDEGVEYDYSVSIEDEDAFAPREVPQTFLAEGTFSLTTTVRARVEDFDGRLLRGATLPILRVTPAQFGSLAVYDADRPYLVYDIDAGEPHLLDGELPIVSVYVGRELRYGIDYGIEPDPEPEPGPGDNGGPRDFTDRDGEPFTDRDGEPFTDRGDAA